VASSHHRSSTSHYPACNVVKRLPAVAALTAVQCELNLMQSRGEQPLRRMLRMTAGPRVPRFSKGCRRLSWQAQIVTRKNGVCEAAEAPWSSQGGESAMTYARH